MKISVVVPNYNGSKYLAECLKSIVTQTLQPHEVIVADDGSTDDSVSIAEEYVRNYSFVKVVKNKYNLGLAANKHNAIMRSTGDFVTTLDSDDRYYNEKKLAHEAGLIKRSIKAGDGEIVAYSLVAFVDDSGTVTRVRRPDEARNGDLFEAILCRSLGFIPRDFLMSKEAYLEVGGFDLEPRLYVDWWFKIKLSKVRRFECTNEIGICYRKHGTGMSKAGKWVHAKWIFLGFWRNRKHLPTASLPRGMLRIGYVLARLFVSDLVRWSRALNLGKPEGGRSGR